MQITLQVVRQLQQQQALYRHQHKTHVNVVGFGANCCDFRFDPRGIPLDELIMRLESCKSAATFTGAQHTATVSPYAGAPSLAQLDALQDLSIPILVDCSAQSNTQALYAACIERGIHVRHPVCRQSYVLGPLATYATLLILTLSTLRRSWRRMPGP